MKPQRPVHLNLLKIRFPLPAIVSILHRASGVLLFLFIPLLLWLFSSSLASESAFYHIHQCIRMPIIAFSAWVMLSALWFHLVAGIRHLCMDVGIGESLIGGRIGAYLVLIFSTLGIALAGVWLW